MNKLIISLIAAFGFAMTVTAQTTTVKDGIWDGYVRRGDTDTLWLREDVPGKIVIKVKDWSDKMDFPVYVTSFCGDTLEVVMDESMTSFGVVSFTLEPVKVTRAGSRTYDFVILDQDGRRTWWWMKGYTPNKYPGALHY